MQKAEQQQVEKQSCLGWGSTFLVPVGIWGVSQDPKGLMWLLGMWDEEGLLSLQTTGAGTSVSTGRQSCHDNQLLRAWRKAPSPGIQILGIF